MKFHSSFHSSGITLDTLSRIASQLDPESPGGGGLVCTAEPLRLRTGVVPGRPLERGVCLEVTILDVDNTGRWNDGLGIGFTTDKPNALPANRLAPRRATQLKESWLGGYAGSWALSGENIWMLPHGNVVWHPSRTLSAGDVVSAVAVGGPSAAIWIFVNGAEVAYASPSLPGMEGLAFPNPRQTPLRGVLDVDGSCLSVQLGCRKRPVVPAPKDEQLQRPSEAGTVRGAWL